jgi:tRNA nucleotidyltransferase (CCA-adding enzyme)
MTEADPAQLRDDFFARLSPARREIVDTIINAAAPATSVYVAGGAVRDLALGRDLRDIDLVAEGDAPAIVAVALPHQRSTVHARFRTVTVHAPGGRIDVATARTERYATPGALPAVAPADIEADMRRRDFTVNAMALALSGPARLVDPSGGAGDLARRLLRVLHDRSFIDDPTRIFRAVRYAARLGFRIEDGTAALMTSGLPFVAKLSGARVRREIELLARESAAGEALHRCQQAGALAAVHPALVWPADAVSLFDDLTRVAAREPLAFALLASHASAADAAAIVERLRLKRDQAAAVEGIARLRLSASVLQRPQMQPSGAVLLLERFPAASVAALVACGDSEIVARSALRYLEDWRRVRPALTGEDLVRMGIPEGPSVGRGLALIRAARLDGRAESPADEEALVSRFVQSIRESKEAAL